MGWGYISIAVGLAGLMYAFLLWLHSVRNSGVPREKAVVQLFWHLLRPHVETTRQKEGCVPGCRGLEIRS